METETELMNLSWNEFKNSTIRTFKNLQGDEHFSDVTLACGGGKQMKAHKVILSSCSPFFKDILMQNPHKHPLLYLKGVDMEDLRFLMRFIYSGEVEIPNEGLGKFLDAANELQIDGLLQKTSTNSNNRVEKEMSAESSKIDEASTNIMEEIESKIHKMTKLAYMSSKEGAVKKEIQAVEDVMDVEDIAERIQEAPNISEQEKSNIEVNIEEDDDGEEDEEEKIPTAPFVDNFKEPESKFECEYCPKTFSWVTELDKHLEKYHTVKNQLQIDDVSAQAENEPRKKVESDKSCDVCLKEFTTVWSKAEHVESVHDMIRYVCDHCEHIANSKRNVRGHINKKHPGKDLPTVYTKIKADQIQIGNSTNTSDVVEHKPQIQDKTSWFAEMEQKMGSRTTMGPEVVEHKPAQNDKTTLFAEIEEKIDAITERRDGLWTCTNCGKTDKTKFHLRRHAESHLEGYLHQCPECPKTFRTRSNLKTHMLNHTNQTNLTTEKNLKTEKTSTNEENGFPCDQCDKTAVTVNALRAHKYRNHNK